MITPFPAGATADALARILADHLGTVFGKPFVVENRAGAGGQIGSQAAVAAAPDGYTLVVSGNASHIVAPAFAPKQLYDGLKDFTHIGFLGGSPVGLVVHPSLPVNSYSELAAYLKAREPMDYTSSGIGTNGFLFGEDLSAREGLRLNHIPYKGGAAAMVDLIAGHVKIATVTFATASGHVRGEKMKALAISSENRLAHFSDIPTFKELGFPDMVSLSWFGISGPRGLPREIVDKINREIPVVLQRPDVKARLDREAIEIKLMSADETTKYFEAETIRWVPLAKALRAKGFKAE
jgi:tripartite-type tricarboxylate transporter receptor subunit TctC